MSSTVIRIETDSFTDNSLMEIHENYFQQNSTQNVNSFRSQVNLRVVHSRPAFSNLNNMRNIAANRSVHNSSLSSSNSSPFSTSISSNNSSTSSTPLTPVRSSNVQSDASTSRNTKSPRTRYVQQCRSITHQLQLTSSNFKRHRLMRSPIVTSKNAAAERKRYQEMLESVFNDSLEYVKNDDSYNCSNNISEGTISSSDNSTPGSFIKKVGVAARVNKARRRFRF